MVVVALLQLLKIMEHNETWEFTKNNENIIPLRLIVTK